jgi:hypothetical protein
MKGPVSAVLLLALSAAAGPATAAVAIDTFTARPNPGRFGGGYPPQIEIEVTVKDRGITRLLGCELLIDFGDGTPEVLQSLADGGARKATLKHVYRKPGVYAAVVRGRPGGGGRACDGERRAGDDHRRDAAGGERATQEAVSVNCPAGWSVVPGSQAGLASRRADRPTPKIECQGERKYLQSRMWVIGCQKVNACNALPPLTRSPFILHTNSRVLHLYDLQHVIAALAS